MVADHYALLGVRRYASIKEINVAWKQFALKYHPDKCNGNDALEEFLKGLEAADTLRDPQRRGDYDKELRAHELHYRTNRAGGYHRSPQTPSAYSSPLNPQSQHSNNPGDWTDPQRSWNRTYNGNGYHGSPPKYSEAQMDMIFDTVKRRERERIAAEREKARQAEAELEKRQFVTEQEMHASETDNCPSDDTWPQKAQIEICEEKKIAQTVLDGGESTGEIIEAAEGRSLGQDTETFPNGNGPAGLDTTASHRSTVFMSATTSFRDGSDLTWLLSTPDSPADWDDSSTDSDGGVLLANFETQNKGEETTYLDCDDLPCTVPDLNPTRPSSSSNPVRTEPSTEGTVHPVENPQPQSSLRPFIPYFKAKLDDPSWRYTHEDMCQELHGLVMDAVCTWMESKHPSHSDGSPQTATDDDFACSHLGSWDKGFGQPECDNCHLWKPLYTLTCQGCGLKRCVRCKFENWENYEVTH
ncbi:uncharacterized protein N7496_009521 [Penicillium cataractarum]|uniref:J domain-containing protein n=1 Tax=Penicillium cataractarum TaxID=2100454 RepID=A0A9W9RTZ8_9EURO|nr:uncharacterized protein N7496_009521 [Penicillium cataractarum]KAJ5363808.1 hypothetical protein N7496_009521 [Penicillium cataractarum]